MTLEEIRALSYVQLNRALRKAGGLSVKPHYDHCDFDEIRRAEAKLTPERWNNYAKHFCDTYTLPEGYSAPVWDEFTLRTGILLGIKYALTISLRQQAEALLWVLTQDDK